MRKRAGLLHPHNFTSRKFKNLFVATRFVVKQNMESFFTKLNMKTALWNFSILLGLVISSNVPSKPQSDILLLLILLYWADLVILRLLYLQAYHFTSLTGYNNNFILEFSHFDDFLKSRWMPSVSKKVYCRESVTNPTIKTKPALLFPLVQILANLLRGEVSAYL